MYRVELKLATNLDLNYMDASFAWASISIFDPAFYIKVFADLKNADIQVVPIDDTGHRMEPAHNLITLSNNLRTPKRVFDHDDWRNGYPYESAGGILDIKGNSLIFGLHDARNPTYHVPTTRGFLIVVKAMIKRCFITSAVLNSLGKNDDCFELNCFRKFRDSFVSQFAPESIDAYYAIAPSIVAKIEASKNKTSIYEQIWHDNLSPAFELIKKGANEEAFEVYKSTMLELIEKFDIKIVRDETKQ